MSENAAQVRPVDVERAFIEGIRTVMIIDDRMLRHDELAKKPATSEGLDLRARAAAAMVPEAIEEDANEEITEAEEEMPLENESHGEPHPADEAPASTNTSSNDIEQQENNAAGALTEDFRKRGWFHDILNNDFDEHGAERAKTCDLVILDYKLKDEGNRALKILSELSASDRLHLVVLYTSEKVDDVWLKVAFSLGPKPKLMEAETLGHLTETLEDLKQKAGPTAVEMVTALAGGTPPHLKSNFSDKSKKNDKDKRPEPKPPTEEELRPFLAYSEACAAHEKWAKENKELKLAQPSHFAASSGDLRWIRADNLFVMMQHKRNLDTKADGGHPAVVRGDDIVQRLKTALQEWNPSFFRRMLRFLRHQVAQAGMMKDSEILRGALGEAALLIYAHGGSNPEENLERQQRVYRKIMEGLVQHVLDAHELRAMPDTRPNDKDLYSHATELVGLPVPASKEALSNEKQNIHFRANDFLAFEDQPSLYLRTGTVFRLPGKATLVGICVTPECDLVRRIECKKPDPKSDEKQKNEKEISGGQDGADVSKVPEAKKSPSREVRVRTAPVVHWRLAELVQDAKEIKRALEDPYQFHHLFRLIGGANHLIKLRPDGSGVPKANTFFVADGGRIQGGSFRARYLLTNEGGEPELDPTGYQNFDVIAQLREPYAIRLLHETGQELSRVGVDFVKME